MLKILHITTIQYFGLLSRPREWLWSPHTPSQLWQFIPYWDFFRVLTALQYKWAKALLLCLVSLESLKNKPAHPTWTLYVLSLRFFTIWNSFLRAQGFFPEDRPPTEACFSLPLSSPKTSFRTLWASYTFPYYCLVSWLVRGVSCVKVCLLSFDSAWIDDNPFQCTVDPQPCWHWGEQSSSAANLSLIPIYPVLVSFAALVHMNCIPCEGN